MNNRLQSSKARRGESKAAPLSRVLSLGALSGCVLSQARLMRACRRRRSASPRPGADAALPRRVGITRRRSITLADAIAQALKNNPDVAMIANRRRAGDRRHRRGRRRVRSAVQPSVVVPAAGDAGELAHRRIGERQAHAARPGVRTGLQRRAARHRHALQLGFTSRRQTTDNQFVTLNPQFPSELSLTRDAAALPRTARGRAAAAARSRQAERDALGYAAPAAGHGPGAADRARRTGS